MKHAPNGLNKPNDAKALCGKEGDNVFFAQKKEVVECPDCRRVINYVLLFRGYRVP